MIHGLEPRQFWHGFGVWIWHGFWGMVHGLDSSQSCMDLGGIVRGGFWQDFGVMLGMDLMEISR